VYNYVQYTYLLLFSTCFGHPRALHREKIAISMRHWYLSLCTDGVCCRHPYRVTNTSVTQIQQFSPDDGHVDAQNM